MKKVIQVLRFFVSITLLVFFAAIAHAAILEVGEGKLYTSIQTAITDAVNGDTVLVYDGTYVENIYFMGKAITVRSVNGAAGTIIDGNASGPVVTFNFGETSRSVLDGFTITNGNNSGSGGGLDIMYSPTITNCTITGNKAAYYGGGIFCYGSCNPTITNSTITGNTAFNGGGIYFVSSSAIIANSTITGNTATMYGGGIGYSESSNPTITNSTITGNTAGISGGGIYVAASSPIVANSTISGNTANNGGGLSGIASSYGSFPTITNSIISGNTANNDGGGIYGSLSPTITNSTITGNTATRYGGGIYGYSSSNTTMKNSILWGDSAPTGKEIYLVGSTVAVTYSDVDQEGYGGINGNIRQDPLFVDPENGNFHLQPNSPCIDAGTSDGAPLTDMEGFPRYDNLLVPNTGGGAYAYYDMGAYEYFIPPNTLTVEKTGSGTVTGSGISCGTDCTETYDYGTVVVLSAAPESGFVFDGWSGGCSGTGSCEVTMDTDVTVTATFTSIISPNEGAIGTKLIIIGSDFGTRKGKVLINGIAAKVAKDGWTPDQITCTITKPPIPIDVAHPVSVVVDKVPTIADGTFTLRGLVLDELLTSSGTYPDPIKITGKFFGTKKGKVYLYNPATERKKNLKIIDWKMDETTGVSELTFVVPRPSKVFPADTYQLKVTNRIGPAPTSPDFELLEAVP